MNSKNPFLFFSTYFHNLIFLNSPKLPFYYRDFSQTNTCRFILIYIQNTHECLDITSLPIGSEESVIMTSNSPWCFFMYSNPSPICSDNFELSKPMAIFGRYFLDTSITFCKNYNIQVIRAQLTFLYTCGCKCTASLKYLKLLHIIINIHQCSTLFVWGTIHPIIYAMI